MKKQIKNRWLHIAASKHNLPADKTLDYKEYAIGLMISIDDISHPDQHEGDIVKDGKGEDEKVMFVDKIYKAKVIGDLVIKDEFEKIYIKSDKRSDSQLLRGQIINTCKKDIPLADHYHDRMILLRHFWYLIDPYLDELDKKEKEGKL